jgi:type IV secretory pathway VirJ component
MLRAALALSILLTAAALGGCATWSTVDGGTTGAARAPVEEHTVLPGTAGDAFVVLYSGDGGASGGTRAIAKALAARGTPTVTVDSLSYFWSHKSPAQAAADLAVIIEHYAQAWGRPRVVLTGYSFGGSALPGIVGNLAGPARDRVRAIVLVAPRDYVEMTLRPHSWLNIRPPHAHVMADDIRALGDVRVVCVHGETDGLAACPRLPAGMVEAHELPGGHTFAGDFGGVASIIAGEAQPAQAQNPAAVSR